MMKNYKNHTGIILMALCLSVALGSCVDDLSSEKNILVAQQSSDKTGGAYTIFVSAGHNASVCKNSCVVITSSPSPGCSIPTSRSTITFRKNGVHVVRTSCTPFTNFTLFSLSLPQRKY